MRFSHTWLKELVPLALSPEELAKDLLGIGFEVSSLARLGPEFTGVVVGEVLAVGAHPNADRLKLCRVSDGSATVEVVCGAPNVAAGQRVPLARVGARLPGGVTIEKSKIRGSESLGMICSASELGLERNGKSPGILVLPADSRVGRDFAELLGPPDAALEIEITPNRPDCLSHLGLARELAVHYGLALTPAADEPPAGAGDGPAALPIEIGAPAECARYRGRLIAGIKVGPSPAWLARRLEACGLRPINNIVDITNLVLLERGQPMHAFDADKLAGDRVAVRFAKAGERLNALDGKGYTLSPEHLVIADAERPVAAAGVIGGAPTGVTESTTRVFLECAHFRPGRVRRAAKALGIRTDSSYRFERGVDLAGVPAATERATRLILELAGGSAGPPADAFAGPVARPVIAVDAARIDAVLGAGYPAPEVAGVLRRLDARFEDAGGAWRVQPPTWRQDLVTVNDLAEEVARHLGYGRLPYARGPVRLPGSADPPLPRRLDALRDALAGLGFVETLSYDFISAAELARLYPGERPEPPALLNPLSKDWAYLRPSLLNGLLRSAALNFNRGVAGLRLFELGRCYRREAGGVAETAVCAGLLAGPWPPRAHWHRAAVSPDFHEAHGLVAALLRGERYEERPCDGGGLYHPGACVELLKDGMPFGRLGALHPELLRRFDLRAEAAAAFELSAEALADEVRARFTPFSPFPAVTRDLSFVADAAKPYAELEAALRARAADLARVDLVDVFTGAGVPAGCRSLTVRLTFLRLDRTLRDEEVNASVAAAVAELEARCGAKLRQ